MNEDWLFIHSQRRGRHFENFLRLKIHFHNNFISTQRQLMHQNIRFKEFTHFLDGAFFVSLAVPLSGEAITPNQTFLRFFQYLNRDTSHVCFTRLLSPICLQLHCPTVFSSLNAFTHTHTLLSQLPFFKKLRWGSFARFVSLSLFTFRTSLPGRRAYTHTYTLLWHISFSRCFLSSRSYECLQAEIFSRSLFFSSHFISSIPRQKEDEPSLSRTPI